MHLGSRQRAEPQLRSAGARILPSIPLPHNLPHGSLAISDMADIFGVTHRTLHFYEEKKLITAKRHGAMRVYDRDQIHVMALVNLCRETGMPVAQIQDLMAELESAGDQSEADRIFHAAMRDRKSELAAQQSNIRRQMQQVSELLDFAGDLLQYSDDHNAGAPSLTEEEQQCLDLMAEGYLPARLARALGKPMNEVLEMEAAIIKKFGSHNRFQAVAKAVLLGIIAS